MNRMVSIILTELASDKLKFEEEMERFINDKSPIENRVSNIKENLSKIVLTEMMIEKWRSYTMPSSDNK